MGVDEGINEIHIIEREDRALLSWPKNALVLAYLFSIAVAGATVFSVDLTLEIHAIRMIYIISMLALLGFIFTNHMWAMSSAIALYLCYRVGLFIFGEGLVLGSIAFAGFIIALTIRAMSVSEKLAVRHRVDTVETFK